MINLPVGLDIRPSTEQNGGGIVVGGCEREHEGTCASGVHTNSFRNIIQWRLSVGSEVQGNSGPVRLDQEVPRRKEPCEGIEVGREGVSQDG